MLDPDFLDRLPDELVEKMNTLAEDITADMARRIAKEGFLTETASWQYEKMRELYGSQVYEYVMERLQSWLGKTQGELRGLFQEAGIQAMKYDDRIYRAAGFTPKALEESPALAALLEAGLKQTSGTFHNLVGTTALGTQRAFFRVCDRAHLQVISGGMDFQRAVREAVEEAADLCPMVEYPSGRKDRLDVAVRRCVVTGVNQTCLKIQESQLGDLGCDLVETTAHGGARPSHAVWQGKVCSFSGKDKRYPDFRSFTGYGRGDGLGGWNCRHSFFPFFDGISESAYPRRELEAMNNATVCYKGKEIPLYEATQRQREMERNIRRFKRRAVGLKAIGQDDSPPLAYVGRWQEQLRGFLQETGLDRDYSREWIKGMSKSQSARTTSAWKHLKNDGGGGIISTRKTLGEWARYTKKAFGFQNVLGIDSLSQEAVEKTFAQMERIYTDFPQLRGFIQKIQISKNQDYAMSFLPIKRLTAGILSFNWDLYRDVEVLANKYWESLENGASVKGSTWDQVGIHELGHALTTIAIRKGNTTKEEMLVDWTERKTVAEIVETAYRNLHDDTISLTKMMKNISSYAVNSEHGYFDTIAEAFVEYYVNPEARFSREIINELKRRL